MIKINFYHGNVEPHFKHRGDSYFATLSGFKNGRFKMLSFKLEGKEIPYKKFVCSDVLWTTHIVSPVKLQPEVFNCAIAHLRVVDDNVLIYEFVKE